MTNTKYMVDLIVATGGEDPEEAIRQLLQDAGIEIVALVCYEREEA